MKKKLRKYPSLFVFLVLLKKNIKLFQVLYLSVWQILHKRLKSSVSCFTLKINKCNSFLWTTDFLPIIQYSWLNCYWRRKFFFLSLLLPFILNTNYFPLQLCFDMIIWRRNKMSMNSNQEFLPTLQEVKFLNQQKC